MLNLFFMLHLLGAVVWVGGMAFALFCLRPAAQEALEGPQRLALMQGVFRRFFLIVWHAMPIVLLTGWAMLFVWYGGFARTGWHIHVMHMTGLLMGGVYLTIAFGPWKLMRSAIAAGDKAGAAAAAEQIRKLVLANLVLGLVTVAVAGWGHGG